MNPFRFYNETYQDVDHTRAGRKESRILDGKHFIDTKFETKIRRAGMHIISEQQSSHSLCKTCTDK